METDKIINLSELNEHDKQLIKTQLEIILNSSYFNSAKQMKRFLEYIVRKALMGESAQLKQYTIGVEGLGFADDFDSDSNPSVRIMGGRVRKRLQEFYNNYDDAENNNVIVTIPKGTYAPKFKYYTKRELREKLGISEVNDSKVSTGPTLAIISYTNHDQDNYSNRVLLQTVDLLAQKCSQLSSKVSVYNPFADKNDPHNLQKGFNEDYSLSIFVQELPENNYEFNCHFVETDSKQMLWSESVKIENENISFSQDELIKKIIADVLDIQQGRLQLHWARNLLLNKKAIPDQFKVLALYRQYYDNFNLVTFAEVVSACDEALDKNPNDIIANAIYADLCRRDYVYSFDQINLALDKGIQSAERVSHLRPDSGDGHFVLGQLFFSLGDWDRSKNEFYKTREISSYNSAFQYAIGYYFCLMGDWTEGLALVNESINTSNAYPSWYHTPIAMYYYNQEKYEEALVEANKILAPNIPLGPMMRSVCCAQLGDISQAKIEYQDLLGRLPSIEKKGRETMLRLFGNENLSNKICDGLEKIV